MDETALANPFQDEDIVCSLIDETEQNRLCTSDGAADTCRLIRSSAASNHLNTVRSEPPTWMPPGDRPTVVADRYYSSTPSISIKAELDVYPAGTSPAL